MRLAIFCAAFFVCFSVQAQNEFPNPGFENWSGGNPVGWSTTNSSFVTNVTQSSIARTGFSSARGDIVLFATIPYPPAINAGVPIGQGIPISQNYSAVTGWYRWHPTIIWPQFGFVITVAFFDAQGMGTAAGTFFAGPEATNWTPFVVTMNYAGGSGQPSVRALPQFTTGIPQGAPSTVIGSYFLLDDVAFVGPTGVREIDGGVAGSFHLEQNYPNPFNPSTNIRFQIPEGSVVKLTVHNVLGEEVATLVNEALNAGSYVADWNAAGMPSGVYFYTLNTNGRVLTKKMMLTK